MQTAWDYLRNTIFNTWFWGIDLFHTNAQRMKTQELFYTISFVTFISWWIIAGIRKKQELLSWIAAIGVILLLVITGSELQIFIESVSFKSSFHSTIHFGFAGAMISGVIGFIFLKKTFKWDDNIYELIALPFFISVALMFSACMFEGCCFGTMTDSSLSITYLRGQPAHTWQCATGIISFMTEKSYPLHPVQLYKVLVCLIAVAFYFIIKRKTKLRGSGLLSACLAFFFLAVFAVTFFEQRFIGGNKNYLLLSAGLLFIPFVAFKFNFSDRKIVSAGKLGSALPIIYCICAALIMFVAEWIVFIPVIIVQTALVTVLIAERVMQTRKISKSQNQIEAQRMAESKINISF